MTELAEFQAYPKNVMLRDGSVVVLRPLDETDAGRLFDFFRSIPAEDRYYLKEDVTDSAVIRAWTSNINWNRVIPIVALVGDRIVADATLHLSRAPALRHAAELRVVVAPDYRDVGLGGRLIRELLDLAAERGLTTAVFSLVAGWQAPAVQAAESAGFREAATLKGWFRDAQGNPEDLVVLTLSLKERRLWWF